MPAAENLSSRGVPEGMVVLAVVWWCRACHSWRGNAVRARAALIAFEAIQYAESRHRIRHDGHG